MARVPVAPRPDRRLHSGVMEPVFSTFRVCLGEDAVHFAGNVQGCCRKTPRGKAESKSKVGDGVVDFGHVVVVRGAGRAAVLAADDEDIAVGKTAEPKNSRATFIDATCNHVPLM